MSKQKGPSSSGEHEAVRRLQDELARGEALTEAIATGASLPPAPATEPAGDPDATPITMPPVAATLVDPLEEAMADLRSFVVATTRLATDRMFVLDGLLDRVREAASPRRRRSPPSF